MTRNEILINDALSIPASGLQQVQEAHPVLVVAVGTTSAELLPLLRVRTDQLRSPVPHRFLLVDSLPYEDVVTRMEQNGWTRQQATEALPRSNYLPLLNPLDLGHALVLLYALALQRLSPLPMPASAAAGGALAFWWLNSVLVRTLHHWAGTPTWGRGALASEVVQTGLSILWTLTACSAMWAATRRHQRLLWMAGAGLLSAVVLKLFFVDLSKVGTLARIVSFLGVGGLMLVIGYVAPMPPAAPQDRRNEEPA